MLNDKAASEAMTAFSTAGREALKMAGEADKAKAREVRLRLQAMLEEEDLTFGVGVAVLYQFAEDLGAGILLDAIALKEKFERATIGKHGAH